MELIEIHCAKTTSEQELLGIEQLIQFIGGLLPGDKLAIPCARWSAAEKGASDGRAN